MTSTADGESLSPSAVDGAGTLLALLREGAVSTVSEMASAMGVSRSTVLQRLDFLLERELVERQEATSGSRGRPASVTRFRAGSAVVLAAQIGMTGCRVAATDLRGEVLTERFFPIDLSQGPAALLRDLEASFDDALASLEISAGRLAGIGIGNPSEMELRGYARSLGAGSADWDRESLGRDLRQHYGAPVFIDLDVNLLALAERRNSWPEVEVLVCVKLGTLIDAAIVVNGAPVRGASGLAGELGHIKVSGSSAPCSCGGVGCLDAVASGSALVRSLAGQGLAVSHVSDVVRLANDGQAEAVLAVREAGRRIGEALSSVVNLLNPAVISAWGYLTEAETPLFAGIREGLYQSALPGSSEQLQLVGAALGDLAGVHGAAQRVIDEVLDPAAVDRMIVSRSWAGAWNEGSAPAA